MSKIESGKFTIEEVPYNLDALLHRIQSMLSVRAQDAGLSLSVELMSEVQYKLIGDSQRIGQILINLVSNAIKFTKQGRVSVKSWLDEERLYFQVIDSGIGMSSDVLQRLFSRFEQADGSISRRFGGSGLGLFISKSLAELMEGEIKVASQEGVGSTFTLILPYQQSDLPVQNGGGSQSDANQVMQQEPLTGHILLAEDTPLLQRLEQRSLEGLGLQVTIAKDGEEAVALASSHNFDLILMDMQMPVMDGIQATKVLREQGEQIPVIALTANVMQKHRDQFHEAGCDAFLGKPIDQYELYQALQMFLSKPMDKPVERTQESDGAGLMPIEWGAQFSVGHALMDRQHQLLVDHINLLIEYSNKPSESARQVMLEVLPKLNEYAARHFRSEEALLARVKYPALESQVAGHEQYGRKIASFYAGKMDQQQLISLIEFLTQWWKHHILIEDMLYKELISSLSVSEQVDEALDTALS